MAKVVEVTAAMSLRQCHCGNVTAAMSLRQCHCGNVTAAMSLAALLLGRLLFRGRGAWIRFTLEGFFAHLFQRSAA